MKPSSLFLLVAALLILPLQEMAQQKDSNQDSVEFAVEDLPLQTVRNQKAVVIAKKDMAKQTQTSQPKN
jgi:hypothetical protein